MKSRPSDATGLYERRRATDDQPVEQWAKPANWLEGPSYVCREFGMSKLNCTYLRHLGKNGQFWANTSHVRFLFRI